MIVIRCQIGNTFRRIDWMKRVISIALALCLCLICFVGCGEKTYDGWEFVTTGEVSYQISKDWRTREQPGNTESYITFEYYVDENHSYGMSYIKPDDLSEKNKTDHDMIEERWFKLYIKNKDGFKELPEREVAGKQAYHCRIIDGFNWTQEYYGIDTPNGYTVFWVRHSDTMDTNIVEDEFFKLLDSIKIK